MIVYVVTAKNDNGFDYGPWCFNRKPNDERLESFLRADCPGEWVEDNDGPGFMGSHLYVTVSMSAVHEGE